MIPRTLRNGVSVAFSEIPVFSADEFRYILSEYISGMCHVSSFFAMPDGENFTIIAVLSNPDMSTVEVFRTMVGTEYQSLTPAVPELHWFEREIYEQWGIIPAGHPWLKPIRFHENYANPSGKEVIPGVTDYYRIEGAQVHQVAVGPVHAGIIEPGHFRFQCHGETVFHLEIELGYQHRGIERAILRNASRIPYLIQTAAGDTTIGHTSAWAMVMEGLTHTRTTPRGDSIRAVALELERLANHVGDLGALGTDIGYLPTSSYNGRIRGDYLNMTAMLCGNRFGRNLVRPGGVLYDMDAPLIERLGAKLAEIYDDTISSVELLWQTPSVMARFENTGTVTGQAARETGLVGVAARACGICRDVRADLPFGAYVGHQMNPVTFTSGDVRARAGVRWFEVKNSVKFIQEELETMAQSGEIMSKPGKPEGDSICIALTEGWRGEICHTAITDSTGALRHYKIVDPSFHNWFGLALALRDQEISDFPLCNKSFNLSYCGHDL